MIQHTSPQQQKPSGMNCPICGGFIPISIQQILDAGQVVCPHCSLVLNINKSQSRAAIDALKKVNDAAGEVRSKEKFKR